MGTSKNWAYRSSATKLPANDFALFPFQFTDVHSGTVRGRRRNQFFEVPLCHNGYTMESTKTG